MYMQAANSGVEGQLRALFMMGEGTYPNSNSRPATVQKSGPHGCCLNNCGEEMMGSLEKKSDPTIWDAGCDAGQSQQNRHEADSLDEQYPCQT